MPSTLITDDEIAMKMKITPPQFVPLEGKAAKEPGNSLGIVQRQLSNGIKLNLKSLNTEPQRANFRLYVPGTHDIHLIFNQMSFD